MIRQWWLNSKARIFGGGSSDSTYNGKQQECGDSEKTIVAMSRLACQTQNQDGNPEFCSKLGLFKSRIFPFKTKLYSRNIIMEFDFVIILNPMSKWVTKISD